MYPWAHHGAPNRSTGVGWHAGAVPVANASAGRSPGHAAARGDRVVSAGHHLRAVRREPDEGKNRVAVRAVRSAARREDLGGKSGRGHDVRRKPRNERAFLGRPRFH